MGRSGSRVAGRALMHLKAIECAHGLKITNKSEIVSEIACRVSDERSVLTICTSLNTWVAMNRIGGSMFIPREVLEPLIELAEIRERCA
ncbi:MAG TPA: hypothetical protein PK659_04170 [Methanothrix sp.]|nr:hypothetical protein [Methanothrix sp.]HOK58030.1 hypothetical protein [Methanothrix sp.]HOL43433.1 hypothetical protein [Methanothrix sp.]HPO88549.1 hypothetical protein [Methanothrix sp.]